MLRFQSSRCSPTPKLRASTWRSGSSMMRRASSSFTPKYSPAMLRRSSSNSSPKQQLVPPSWEWEDESGVQIQDLDGRKIYDLFYWEKAIQEDGDGGKVVFCRRKDSEAPVFDLVMKIKSKDKLAREKYEERFRTVLKRMLNLPPHPNVMPLEEVLEDARYFYVVMKRASSDLTSGLLSGYKDGKVPAATVRTVMKQILEAVDHVHSQGILHRDIKLDNLVLQALSVETKRVVLIDFDHADPDFSELDADKPQNHLFGTRSFNAPETWLGYFSKQSDLYSVGVVFYMLLTGKSPHCHKLFEDFEDRSPRARQHICQETYRRLQNSEIDWLCDPFLEQTTAKHLCRRLLAFVPSARPESAGAALAHRWFLDGDGAEGPGEECLLAS